MSSDGGLSMYQYVNKPAVIAATSIFCGLTILCNLFIIIIIILSRLRSSAKHLIILALCIVDLYEAFAFIAPIAEFYSLEKWIHDPKYLQYADYSQYYILTSFRVLLMIAICGVALMNMFVINKRFLTLVSVSMIFASIFYSLVLVLPSIEGDPDLTDFTSQCFSEVTKAVRVAAFFPPAIILIALIIDICIVSCCCKRSFDDVTSGGDRRFPVDVVIASVAFLVYTIPYQMSGAYYSSCSGSEECEGMHIRRVITTQWELAGHFVLPLLWLLCPDVRREVTRICCCRSGPPAQPGPHVNYHMQSYGTKM